MSRFKKLSYVLWRRQNKMVFSKFPHLDRNLAGVTIFRGRACVATGGLDADMIRKYVKYQKTKERREEQLQFEF